jgi:hypothetical protein
MRLFNPAYLGKVAAHVIGHRWIDLGTYNRCRSITASPAASEQVEKPRTTI